MLLQITFELRKLVTLFWQHRVPNVKTRQNMYILYTLTFKGQCQNSASVQGHTKSLIEPSRSYCITVDAAVREKHIETIPSALSLLNQKLEAENECDLL